LRRAESSGGSRAANADGAPRKHEAFHSSPAGESQSLGAVRLGTVADFSKNTNLLNIGENFMAAKQLSEVYEKLKELRRQGGEPNAEFQSEVARLVGEAYASAVRIGLGPTATWLRMALVELVGNEQSASLIRTLEIKTLADRIFGDEKKAEVWLQRPNGSLSGQKPADLVNDELGTAVVREMLERIDHGIFA
jgi:putative toxin-antitoxin system antitoxin component (TIGR02293 family)